MARLRNTSDSRLAVWGISPRPDLLTSVGIVRSRRLRILMKLGATESVTASRVQEATSSHLPSSIRTPTLFHHFFPSFSTLLLARGPNVGCLVLPTLPTPHPPLDRGGLSVPWWPISHSSANCCYTMSINLSGVHTLPPPVPRVVWLCGQQHLIMAESQFQHKFGWP